MLTEKETFKINKELTRLKKEEARPKSKAYLYYMFLILALIYIMDEISTNLPNSLSSEINLYINTMNQALASGFTMDQIVQATFGGVGPEPLLGIISSGLSSISLIALLSNVMLIVSMFYRPLADRFGRKIFLFINALGMGLSSLLFFCADNIFVYAIAFFMLRFFVTPDQQIVYLFEIAPEKYRNTVYSLTKGVAELGLIFIALLRKFFLNSENYQSYKWIFLSVAIVTVIVSFLALLFAKESDAFLKERISYLEDKLNHQEGVKEELEKTQGGFIAALKYTFKNKQVLFICIATALVELIYAPCNGYSSVLNSGFLGVGGLSQEAATEVAFYFPFSCALISAVYGFISDKFGRKITSIALLSVCALSYVGMCLSLYYSLPTWFIGILLGLVLGADWSNGDILSLLAGESSPTNLRASVMSAWSLFFGVGMILSQGFATLAPKLFGYTYLSLSYLCLSLPAMVISIVVLMSMVKETKGVSLTGSTN